MGINDLRHAWRTIIRMPVLAVVVVVSLGAGIGANTAVFSWRQAVVLRPLPGVADAGNVDRPSSHDADGRRQRLRLLTHGRRLNFLHHVHTGYHPAKRGKALAVAVPSAAEVELGLIANTDEEIAARRIGAVARHRDGTHDMLQARDIRAFEGNR
jgi:hypothetical protein